MTFYRKYRPQKFSDLVGQDHIRDTLLEAVKESKLSQAYLFTGPRGTGKTTTARLIAKVANCLEVESAIISGKAVDGEPCGQCANCLEIAEGKSLDIIEIDAASNRGIDDIRELREQVRFAPSKSKFKIYIIDEVHMLTKEAFNALLKTLEEPPRHAIFILATTEPHKVLPTIISRTQRFDFKRINPSGLKANLKKVADSEGLKSEPEALEMLAVLADGGGRDSLSLLDQVAAYSSDISVANVRSILGIVEMTQIVNLLRAIFNSDAEEGLKIARSFYEQGLNLPQLNASIVDVLRKLLTYSITEQFMAAETEENKAKIIELGTGLKASHGSSLSGFLLIVIKRFIDAGKMMKETIDPLVALEVAIVESSLPAKPETNSKPAAQSISVEKVRPAVANLKESVREEAASAKDNSKELGTQADKPSGEAKKKAPPADLTDVAATGLEEKPLDKKKDPLKEMPQEIWDNIVSVVKEENTTLAALLRDAKPMNVESGKLVLGVKFKFHKDKISESKNVQILEGVICNVTGGTCHVQCEIVNFAADKKKESHSDEELASEAERVFME